MSDPVRSRYFDRIQIQFMERLGPDPNGRNTRILGKKNISHYKLLNICPDFCRDRVSDLAVELFSITNLLDFQAMRFDIDDFFLN